MKKTGIFYHISFSKRSYLTRGTRLDDFPGAIEHIVAHDHVVMYESPHVEEKWILRVHTPELIRGVEADHLCSTAWHSAGGVMLGGEKIVTGEVTNGFAFIGAGGHHSGRNYFGGYCCFNDVVMMIHYLRELHGVRRYAILDTDAHHGDGTRDLVTGDPEVLHVCFCDWEVDREEGTKVCVRSPGRSFFRLTGGGGDPDTEYAAKVAEVFPGRARGFKPELLVWYFGFDTHRGDYGDRGLTVNCYLDILDTMMKLADELTDGKLLVVLAGGSVTSIATAVIPPIISRLAGLDR